MKWLIVTETYQETSNGIKIMHKICHELNKLGETAYLAFITPISDFTKRRIFINSDPSLVNANLNTPVIPKNQFTKEFLDEAVVIYPDILVGNQLNAKKIVRFLGNRQSNWPHKNLLSIEEGAFILSHSKIFHPKPNAVLFNAYIDDFFYEENKLISSVEFKNRNLNLMYHGKGIYYGNCDVYKNTFFIDRRWLQDRYQLALLLKQTKYFFTYDSLSNVNGEAVAAGAVPVIMRYDPWTEKEINSLEHSYMPRGKFLELKDGNAYASIDYEEYVLQRKEYLESAKYIQDSWNVRLKTVVEQIKHYFKG